MATQRKLLEGVAALRRVKDWDYINRQMSRQVSSGSAGEYQEDEQAGVARLRWRVSV